jgi:hypothetical protein
MCRDALVENPNAKSPNPKEISTNQLSPQAR